MRSAPAAARAFWRSAAGSASSPRGRGRGTCSGHAPRLAGEVARRLYPSWKEINRSEDDRSSVVRACTSTAIQCEECTDADEKSERGVAGRSPEGERNVQGADRALRPVQLLVALRERRGLEPRGAPRGGARRLL